MKGIIFSNSETTRNVGPYRIAHVLRSQGWNIEVIDFFKFWSESEIKQLLQSRVDKETKFIGFGTLFHSRNNVPYWFFDLVKKEYPDLITIYGTQVKTGIDHKNVNYTISGWADRSIVALLKYLFSNGNVPRFSKGKYTKNINSNDHYPAFPPKDLTVEYQPFDYLEPYETLSIEWARGCKFKCKFCNFPVLGVKGDYSRSAEDLAAQVKNTYYQYGIKKYIVADETVNDSTQKIIKYADEIEKLSFSPDFTGFIRADLLVNFPEQMEHLARMNFFGHYYGVESFNYQSAKSIGKGMKSEKIKNGLIDIKNYFESNFSKRYRGTIGLIVGLPYETTETLDSTINWLTKNWNTQSFNPYILELSVGDLTSKSILSLNYEKYGFREYKNISQADQETIDNFFRTDKLFKTGDDLLFWENDNLNIADAIRIKKEWIR